VERHRRRRAVSAVAAAALFWVATDGGGRLAAAWQTSTTGSYAASSRGVEVIRHRTALDCWRVFLSSSQAMGGRQNVHQLAAGVGLRDEVSGPRRHGRSSCGANQYNSQHFPIISLGKKNSPAWQRRVVSGFTPTRTAGSGASSTPAQTSIPGWGHSNK
jgi:hypothetical protein